MKKDLSIQNHSYSDGIVNKKILMCGPPMPPPYGGISVHFQTVKDKFERQGNRVFHHNTLATYRYRWYPFYLLAVAYRVLSVCPDIIYYHTLSLPKSDTELKLLIMMKRFLGYMLTTVDHDCLHLLKRPVRFRNSLNRLIPFIDQQVLIGDSTYQSYCDAAIDAAPAVSVERAFVPASYAAATVAPLPDRFAAFRATHSPLITLACTRLVFLDGRDLYGVDTGLEVLRKLRAEFPNAGLVCLVGTIDEPGYYRVLLSRIVEYGLQDAVCMINGVHQLWPLLQKTDLLLRPTLCDGASVSEDEAHHIGIPVVASDVCLRHNRTTTYRSGSIDDCSKQVSRVLNDRKKQVEL
ncbi:glycosyltransferase [Candidatus Dependentiae bacterium]|nr:glycosyltransferase [Candidatus Dependentiae bacterium]MCC7415469.1 glycosyltransferase [Campylobacterota bacterium]